MRVLIGHTNQIPQLRTRRPLPGREACGDEILAFGNDYTHVPYQPAMAWTDLLAGCPRDWTPDVYIHWSPEYNALPSGLEDANCLTVGVWGDWNLGGTAIRAVANLFDVQFADRNGGEMLRQAGFDNVHYAPLWAQNPEQHRRLPASAVPSGRDIDILMIGNFNHGIQSERAKWLARVATLSERYNVVLTTGVYGEEYVRLMNRAKIVFNRSIRGEMNMRAFEAPACGALLFYEAENPEIRDVYTDGVDAVFYDDSNLERLLETYLAPENAELRENIAEAGWQTAQAHSYAHHFAGILNQLEPLMTARQSGERFSSRVWHGFAPDEQRNRLATQWLLSSDRRIYPAVERLLNSPSAGRLSEQRSAPSFVDGASLTAKLGLSAVLLGEWANALQPGPARDAKAREALYVGERAVSFAPDNLLAQINLAYLRLAFGQVQSALPLLSAAAEALNAPGLSATSFAGVPFPRTYDRALAAWEMAQARFAADTTEGVEAARNLLQERVHRTLAEAAFAQSDFCASLDHAETAAAAVPHSAEAHLGQARALTALGRAEAAHAAYRTTLEIAPFLMEAREEAIQLALDTEDADKAAGLLAEWERLLRACPIYAPIQARCDALKRQARELARARVQPQPAAPAVTRLLAFPNWRNPADWQEFVRAFTDACRPGDPVQLLLRAAPEDAPDPQAILHGLHRYLTQTLRCAPNALPNITLVNAALPPHSLWKLFSVADTLLVSAPLPALLSRLAAEARVPIQTPQQIGSRN